MAAVAAIAAATVIGVVDVRANELVIAARSPAHYLFFSGVDLWRSGGFAHGGLLWSPHGLERDGFTLKLLLGGGRYRYRSGGTEVTGNNLLTAVTPGWRFRRERWQLLVLAV